MVVCWTRSVFVQRRQQIHTHLNVNPFFKNVFIHIENTEQLLTPQYFLPPYLTWCYVDWGLCTSSRNLMLHLCAFVSLCCVLLRPAPFSVSHAIICFWAAFFQLSLLPYLQQVQQKVMGMVRKVLCIHSWMSLTAIYLCPFQSVIWVFLLFTVEFSLNEISFKLTQMYFNTCRYRDYFTLDWYSSIWAYYVNFAAVR